MITRTRTLDATNLLAALKTGRSARTARRTNSLDNTNLLAALKIRSAATNESDRRWRLAHGID